MSADQRLSELGLDLPQPFPPAGSYVAAVRSGSLLYLSGTGPVRADGSFVTGKVGDTVDLEAAIEAARLTALQLLAAMQRELGSLDKVRRIVKTLGMVNCAPGFNRTPQVIDGCSNLLIDVLATPDAVPDRPWAWPSCRSTSPWRSSWSPRWTTEPRSPTRASRTRSSSISSLPALSRGCGVETTVDLSTHDLAVGCRMVVAAEEGAVEVGVGSL